MGRVVDAAALRDRRPHRPGGHRGEGRADGHRRLHDRAALQARAGRGRRAARPRHDPARDRGRQRQLPHRPLRARGHRPRARHAAALDRGRHRLGRDARAARRGRRTRDRPRRGEPRRLPLGLPRRGARAHPHRARRRRADPLGPLPLRGLRARHGRPVGLRPRRRLHLQVPQRRTGLPGVRLRARRPPGRAEPADPGLDGHGGRVRDGSRVRAGRAASVGSSAARRRSSA